MKRGERSTGFRSYLEQRWLERSLSPQVKVETDSVEASKSFVAVGLGASEFEDSGLQQNGTPSRLQRDRAGR